MVMLDTARHCTSPALVLRDSRSVCGTVLRPPDESSDEGDQTRTTVSPCAGTCNNSTRIHKQASSSSSSSTFLFPKQMSICDSNQFIDYKPAAACSHRCINTCMNASPVGDHHHRHMPR
jgi:hypothetical protein